MKLITSMLSLFVPLSFAHTGKECYLWLYDAVVGFILFVIGCFVFALIFWAVYLWFVKNKQQKIL